MANEPKWTPGSWTVDNVALCGDGLRYCDENGRTIGNTGAYRRGPQDRWIEREEAEANAYMSAAATDMYEALPDLSSVIAWLVNGCDPKQAAKELLIYDARIRQAQAKARGE